MPFSNPPRSPQGAAIEIHRNAICNTIGDAQQIVHVNLKHPASVDVNPAGRRERAIGTDGEHRGTRSQLRPMRYVLAPLYVLPLALILNFPPGPTRVRSPPRTGPVI